MCSKRSQNCGPSEDHFLSLDKVDNFIGRYDEGDLANFGDVGNSDDSDNEILADDSETVDKFIRELHWTYVSIPTVHVLVHTTILTLSLIHI